jgi:hypothetical protein
MEKSHCIMKNFLLLLLTLGSMTMARAQTFDANLDPFQEVPPHNTPAFGSGDFTLSDVTVSGGTLTVDTGSSSYADLLGGATTIRVGDAAVGANGPTIFTFTLDTPGNTSGTYSGSGALTPAQITDLNNGNLYVNITDTVFPSGEIRGQIIATPEPASWTLFFICLGLLASWRICTRPAIS